MWEKNMSLRNWRQCTIKIIRYGRRKEKSEYRIELEGIMKEVEHKFS